MTETAPEAAPAVVTPGQADWEARRDSSFARAGLPVGDQFVSWHRLSAEEQADSEAGAQAAIAAAKWPANLTLADTLDYLAGQWESNAEPHNFKDPAERAVARRYAADLRAALRAATAGATQGPTPKPTADGRTAVPLADEIHPTGYQGAAAHTFTTGCDGFHPVGQQCNLPAEPTMFFANPPFPYPGDDDDPWAEANAAGAL